MWNTQLISILHEACKSLNLKYRIDYIHNVVEYKTYIKLTIKTHKSYCFKFLPDEYRGIFQIEKNEENIISLPFRMLFEYKDNIVDYFKREISQHCLIGDFILK